MGIRKIARILLAGTVLSLAACGGGGGGHVESTPPPPPPPPPPPESPPVTIFASPSPGEYASVGVSTADHIIAAGLHNISAADADQIHIRYNAGGFYEVEIPGSPWERLVHDKALADPTSENIFFQPASAPQGGAYLSISGSRHDGYSYSELGQWAKSQTDDGLGFVAFGVPTPSGSVPISGTATYSGRAGGVADVIQPADAWFPASPSGLSGDVDLNFDFAAGTLAGSMALNLYNRYDDPDPLGTFSFIETVFSTGSATYSGKFDTSVSGSNFFLGQFTGPNAEETIGAWALPFHYSVDGMDHQALGAWIAKRGP